MGEIRAVDAGLPFPGEGEGQVACAAAEIEDFGFGACKNGPQMTGNSFAPEAIELEREEMVQEVIARGDLREHFADFARGVGFVCGTFGLSAFGGDGGVTPHFSPGCVFVWHRLESVRL